MTIAEAIDRLNHLYESTATHTFGEIATGIADVCKELRAGELKEVCHGFNIRGYLTSKREMQRKIHHKISERKARNERSDAAPYKPPTKQE